MLCHYTLYTCTYIHDVLMHTEFFTYIDVEMASGDNETTSKKTTTHDMLTSKASSRELGE